MEKVLRLRAQPLQRRNGSTVSLSLRRPSPCGLEGHGRSPPRPSVTDREEATHLGNRMRACGGQRLGKVTAGIQGAQGSWGGHPLPPGISIINRETGGAGITLALNPKDTGITGCKDFKGEELKCSR